MALIFEPESNNIYKHGEGWKVITLADSAAVGTSAMVARRWSLQAGARTPLIHHGENDEMLYVIRGSGEAVVADETFYLEQESLLWLETGDSFHLVAGESGLEILQGYAPGE